MAPDDARDAAPLSERVEIAGREIDVEDDYDYGYEDEGDAPLVPAKKVPNGSVYEAARAGDVERLTWLVHEEGVDVNARDRWDSVPLYYACLAGQLEAARVLLEAGAICSEHTFDGDRCHYAALTLRIRRLLKRYEMRPPPLDPLPKAFKDLLDATAARAASLPASAAAPHAAPSVPAGLLDPCDPLAPDVAFHIAGRVVPAHKPILAARSHYFHHAFAGKWRDRTEVFLANQRLTHGALVALLGFVYSDRLDVPVAGLPDLARACRAAKCGAGLVRAVERERVHDKLAQHKVPPTRALGGEREEEEERSERGREREEEEEAQRRFILTAASLPEEERLVGGMQQLLARCMGNSDTRAMEADVEAGDGCGEDGGECSDSGGGTGAGGGQMGEEGAGDDGRRRVRFGTVESGEQEGRGWMRGEDGEWRGEGANGGEAVRVQGPDHADCCFSVAGCMFRCHRVIMAARCDYFRVLFNRQAAHSHAHTPPAPQQHAAVVLSGSGAVLPCFQLPDLTAYAFHKILEFIYTDRIQHIAVSQAIDVIDAAARFLLFPLKRAVADALIPQLHSADMPSLCHWLLAADLYGVWKLREYVLDVMAANFDAFAACPAFCAMLARLPPPSGDDSVRTTAPSLHGEQLPASLGQASGAMGGDGVGGESMNVLDDLREKWLELEGAELEERDASAAEFDKRLETLAALALGEEEET
ncbi:hypothetical protein CLOP_g11409 [Closterium sp. NIES-67]|nr:hypothetical protein CLOP_g11409 [Closterium sp. NIES-67]